MSYPRLFLIAFGALAAAAAANPRVELVPTSPGPYRPGERVVLKFFLAQEAGDADLPLRLVQFDFTATSRDLQLDDSFVFDYSAQALCGLQPEMCGEDYEEFPSLTGEVAACATVFEGLVEDLVAQIILPRSGPILVGMVGLTLPDFPGEFAVDVINPQTPYPTALGAQVHFDFQTPTAWLARDFVRTGDPRFVSRAWMEPPGFRFEFLTDARPPDCLPADCDDQNVCTTDECVEGTCLHHARAGDCDDGDSCTLHDICVAGVCAGQPVSPCCQSDAECDDGDPCTSDVCVGWTCAYSANVAACDDNDPCTINDRCANGVCIGQAVIPCCWSNADCDDGNMCTRDLCVDHVCQNAARAAVCDDGDPCTAYDTCADGACAGQPIPGCCVTDDDCDDGDPDTVDRCEARYCTNVRTEIASAGDDAAIQEPPADVTLPDTTGDPVGDPDETDARPPADGSEPASGPMPQLGPCGSLGMVPPVFMALSMGYVRIRRLQLRRR